MDQSGFVHIERFGEKTLISVLSVIVITIATALVIGHRLN
jgi:hypothetical protein